ncbi:hypothetical protein ACFQ48_12955 [Hymenobacter caeli]|uniref:Tetratricopeptide repeat protein n=1 Tax=Hymenobacter caeli TaxID=2735894 RepID=A0ABX2FUZ4_9BACT|nr:hypothetical protein [Hymenobacter caeli]NRT20252.1 hypothetical protein [Hymenobacter caeli]
MPHLRRACSCTALLVSMLGAGRAPGQPGPTGAALFRQGQQLEAAGNKAAAATAYQQAYAAYTSVDDSDGVIKALARKKALAGAGPAAAGAPPAPALRPTPAPALPLAGSMAGGRPVGLFFMSRYLMALHSLEKATHYFTPAGRVFVDPTGFSAGELAALLPGARGTHSFAGNKMAVRWASNQTGDGPVEPQATTFARDMGLFLAVRPFAGGQALLGSFEGGSSASLGSGTTAVASDLAFRPGGTYSRSSALGSTGDGSTARAGASSAGTGRWQLSGRLLTPTDGQGAATRGVAYPIETDDKTGQLVRFYFGGIGLQAAVARRAGRTGCPWATTARPGYGPSFR